MAKIAANERDVDIEQRTTALLLAIKEFDPTACIEIRRGAASDGVGWSEEEMVERKWVVSFTTYGQPLPRALRQPVFGRTIEVALGRLQKVFETVASRIFDVLCGKENA